MSSIPSNYSPIWDALKVSGACKVAAHPALHSKIIKAVVNKKHRDRGYHLLMSERRIRVKMWYKREHSMIRFWLAKYDNLTGVSLEELGGGIPEFPVVIESLVPVINISDGGNIV